jgi:flagellar basal-body rod protein FlgB
VTEWVSTRGTPPREAEVSNTLFDGLHHGLGQVLDLRMAQHTLTAANLANSDTPGYKAKFIPFDKVLGEAVNQRSAPGMRTTHALHNAGLDANVSDPSVSEIEAAPWVADGNSVDPEREAVRLKENSILFSGVSRGLGRRMALLKFAASNGERG